MSVSAGSVLRPFCAAAILFALLLAWPWSARSAPEALTPQEADALAVAASGGDRSAIARLLDLGHRGDPAAQARIGWLYYEGKVVRQDFAAAFEWIARAADGGDAGAMNALGHLYQEGLGTAKDRSLARKWYASAAEKGQAAAASNLGVLLLEGDAKDWPAALAALNQAAAAGHAVAMYNLGRVYDEGRGATEDVDAARRWYARAA